MSKLTYHEPANKVTRMKKFALDRVKKRLDRIRFEQAEIYSNFKKKYYHDQLDELLTEEDLRELHDNESSVVDINSSLIHVNRVAKKFSF